MLTKKESVTRSLGDTTPDVGPKTPASVVFTNR